MAQQFKGDKLTAILKMYFSKHIKPNFGQTRAHFEKEMGFYSGHPGLRELWAYLEDNNILLLDKVYRGKVLYYIDRKKLKELISGQTILMLYNKYLKEVAILYD